MKACEPVTCDFCIEGHSGQVVKRFARAVPTRDRIVARSETAFVVPTLSPIAAGHVLVIPREHRTSMAQLAEDERADLLGLGAAVRDRLLGDNPATLTFEHGIGIRGAGGCGISHCHLHVLPLPLASAQAAFDRFKHRAVGCAVRAKSTVHPEQSYTSMRIDTQGSSSSSSIRIGDFPSQFLRNLVEEAMGVPRTNWRDLTNAHLLAETLLVTSRP